MISPITAYLIGGRPADPALLSFACPSTNGYWLVSPGSALSLHAVPSPRWLLPFATAPTQRWACANILCTIGSHRRPHAEARGYFHAVPSGRKRPLLRPA